MELDDRNTTAGNRTVHADGQNLSIPCTRPGRTWSELAGKHAQDIGRMTRPGLPVARSRPQVHGFRISGRGRALAYRAGQVMDGRVAGRGDRIVGVDEPIPDASRRPAG